MVLRYCGNFRMNKQEILDEFVEAKERIKYLRDREDLLKKRKALNDLREDKKRKRMDRKSF
jgi:uncharacterized protein YjgD (DUF1641 family)